MASDTKKKPELVATITITRVGEKYRAVLTGFGDTVSGQSNELRGGGDDPVFTAYLAIDHIFDKIFRAAQQAA